MDTLISVLLYLNALHPGNYQYQQIQAIASCMQIQTTVLEADPIQMNMVMQVFEPQVPSVIIIDWQTGK